LIPALSIDFFIHLSPHFTTDTSVINRTVYPSFPWLLYWYQRYPYDCLSIFPLTSILIPALSIRLFVYLSPDFTIDSSIINTTLYPSFPCIHYWYQRYQWNWLSIFPRTSLLIPALSIRLFIHLSPDFTIDTIVINRTVYQSFLRLHYWYQRYQYDCLSIFPLTLPLIPALSIRLFIRVSPDFTIYINVFNTTLYPYFPWLHYWYQCYQYDFLSSFPLTSLLIPALLIRLIIHISPDFTIDTSVINKNVIHLSPDFTLDTNIINTTVYPSFPWLHYWYQRYQ